jgi:hypothetical protein
MLLGRKVMSLTIAELKDKIAMVETDMTNMRLEDGAARRAEMLNDYLDYLKYELLILEKTNNG